MRKLFIILIVIGSILMMPWGIISWQTHDRVYRDINTMWEYDVGLLLGTTPSVQWQENLFFTTRIEAAKELYERGKIKHILVSWDNSTAGYNEPQYMKNALLARGIPEEALTLDYAGFRTLDSIVRAREVFSLTEQFVVISQPFHVERALFLGDARDINTVWYGAANVALKYGPMAYIREIPARWLALYDAYIGTEPAVLWEPKPIRIIQ
jgi:SanA protein